jgi:5-methyltetrahydrofolate--homocysteine methyltransferase
MKKPSPALEAEGRAILADMVRDPSVEVRLAARFFAARREGDTLLLDKVRLPMLRQEEGPGRSLADFVPPSGSGPFGIFALAVHGHHPKGCSCEACRNEYESMMRHAVRVTLAEAASSWLDKQLEPLGVPVFKPAAGYASCPDHSLKRDILALLPAGLGISLTESCAMQPDASICGFVVLHPQGGYPDIHHISPTQFEQYAKARGFSPKEARTFLSHLL